MIVISTSEMGDNDITLTFTGLYLFLITWFNFCQIICNRIIQVLPIILSILVDSPGKSDIWIRIDKYFAVNIAAYWEVFHENMASFNNYQFGRFEEHIITLFVFCIFDHLFVPCEQIQKSFLKQLPVCPLRSILIDLVFGEYILVNNRDSVTSILHLPLTILINKHIVNQLFFTSTIPTTHSQDER